ncbi:hypothetical protein HYT53_04410 [Candidatus Woesearchaeota archaeon]|nr:hypothetical protein [Candidatus Woesearchaeota archaeon]
MSFLDRLENISRNVQNFEQKKKIELIIKHVKLYYKYLGEGITNKYYNITGNTRAFSEFEIIFNLLHNLLKNYHNTITSEYQEINPDFYILKIDQLFEHILDLLEIDLTGDEQIQEGNIFLGIEEKLERANKSARDGNAEGLFSSCHTVVELLLKDKLGIALDMDGARLGKILGICIRHDVFKGNSNILQQLDKNVCLIDNWTKHEAFNPSFTQMNDALSNTIQAYRVLKGVVPNINPEVKEEISKILIKNN